MSSALRIGSIQTPASLGLNTEDPALSEDPRIALVLTNAAWDGQGRVCARRGWNDPITTGSHAASTDAIFEYVESATSSRIVSAAGGKLYEFDGTDTLTDETGTLTPSDDDWQFLNFNGKCIGVQAGETPIQKTGAASFADISASSGSLPTGNAGLSAWGRLWVTDADEIAIKWCATLDETDWGGAGAGSLDTTEVWPDGADKVVALAEWQDRLVIFGTRSVLIYSGAEDPTASSFALVETLRVGCLARDSVVGVADDLIWLSVDGLHSMRRAIEFSNLPHQGLALGVKQNISEDISLAINTPETIRAGYSRVYGLYMLRIGNQYWGFDVREGIFRPTRWTGIGFTSLCEAADGTIYFGQSGTIGVYQDYDDDGSSYQFNYKSAYLNLAEGREVFPKTARVTVVSTGDYQVSMGVSYDYIPDEESSTYTIAEAAKTVAEWQPPDVATTSENEWGTAEWSGSSTSVIVAPFDLSGAGSRVQLSFNVNINGHGLCLQRIDVTSRLGRIAA